MATRVTAEEVEAIIEIDSGLVITPFITAANLLVTKVCTDASLSDELLKEIERWVSAHLVAIRQKDANLTMARVGPAAEGYLGKVDLHLDATLWGQQAQMLDTSGALATLSKKSSGDKVEIHHLGTF